MGESRPDSPASEPGRRTPLQTAWADYQNHTADCECCRTKGGGRCEEAALLWSMHRDLCDAAYAALAAEWDRT